MANRAKPKGLNSGRPPLTRGSHRQSSGSVTTPSAVNARRKSSKATRALINKHHQLHKARAAAMTAGNQQLVADLSEQIDQLGGLAAYQAASLTGQDKDRGGDSSDKLVEWLRKHNLLGPKPSSHKGLRVLEVGALSSKNAISSMIGKGVELVKRIDLHSQEPEVIEQADFMTFPIPQADAEKYDVLSLSLVLNYVPDVGQRGEMLRRTTKFLRLDQPRGLPCLFLVLPLACLTNSRYMTHQHFTEIMESLSFELIESHESAKLSYQLFRMRHFIDGGVGQTKAFKKVEINPGRRRNNFAIVLETQ